MKLAFMSFSMMREAFLGKMDADTLCAVAAETGLHILDLQEAEIALYGEAKLKAAIFILC